MTHALLLALSILLADAEPAAAELLKRSYETARSLRSAAFRLRRELVDEKGVRVPGSEPLETEIAFARDAPLDDGDPYQAPVRFRAKGAVPASMLPPGAEEGGAGEIAFDGKVLFVRRAGVVAELPLHEAELSVWDTAESAVLIGGLADPGLLELHPEGRVADLGAESVDGETCRRLEIAFPMVKCFPAGADPRAAGFELFDDPAPAPPAEPKANPDGIVCFRVRVRLRVSISTKDGLVRRVVIPAYGADGGAGGRGSRTRSSP